MHLSHPHILISNVWLKELSRDTVLLQWPGCIFAVQSLTIVLRVPNNTFKVLRDKAALENLRQVLIGTGMSNFIKDLLYFQQRKTVSLVLYSRPVHKKGNETRKK